MADVKRGLDERGDMVYTIATEDLLKPITICKSIGNPPSYIVHIEGRTPKALEGRYTHPDRALPHVLEYLRTKPLSATVKRNRNTAAREAQKKEKQANASASKSDSSEQLQSGSGN